MNIKIEWYEDNPAACLDNGFKRPTRIWERGNGSLKLVESCCEELFCPKCSRSPYRSERCVQRKPKGDKVQRKPRRRELEIASKNQYTDDELAERVGRTWLEVKRVPGVADLRGGRPSGTIIRRRLGGIGRAVNAGRAWLEREGKWYDGLEAGND